MTNKLNLSTYYDHFNLGLHVGDLENSVLNRRNQLLSSLPTSTKIQWLDQVHGSKVALIAEYSPLPIQADACITQQKNIALAIMTADCLPILISNKEGTEIAAIHAGWRPLADNIISKTLMKMKSAPQELVVWLGPCIGQTHFEVGAEVKQAFVGISSQLSAYFKSNNNGKYLADLSGIATMLLGELGVTSVERIEQCTFSQKSKYYSYRRDQQTGRMASVISIS